jgi:hypothetical protein
MFKLIAAIASFFLPGAGQLIQGEFAMAILWFILGVCIIPMPIGNIICALYTLFSD